MVQGARTVRIGKNMKMFRDQLDLTQDELATRANISSGALIAQYEAGTKMPSLEKAMDLAFGNSGVQAGEEKALLHRSNSLRGTGAESRYTP